MIHGYNIPNAEPGRMTLSLNALPKTVTMEFMASAFLHSLWAINIIRFAAENFISCFIPKSTTLRAMQMHSAALILL